MKIRHNVGALILMPIFFITLLCTYTQFNLAILYENGTCTNENITKLSNQKIITNGTVDDFLKSLPSDNTILAELVCQNPLSQTVSK